MCNQYINWTVISAWLIGLQSFVPEVLSGGKSTKGYLYNFFQFQANRALATDIGTTEGESLFVLCRGVVNGS